MRAIGRWLVSGGRLFVRLVVVAAILIAVILAALFVGLRWFWGDGSVERVLEVEAPRTDWMAVEYRVDRTGATGGFEWEVRLVKKKDTKRSPKRRGALLWESYREVPLRLTWTDAETLEIVVRNEQHELRGGVVHGQRSHGITTRTLVDTGRGLEPYELIRP